jgi:hypothetical protein
MKRKENCCCRTNNKKHEFEKRPDSEKKEGKKEKIN